MKDCFLLRILEAFLFVSLSWMFLNHYEEISFHNVQIIESQIEELPEGEYILEVADRIPSQNFVIFFLLTSMIYITMSILGIHKMSRIVLIVLLCLGIKYMDWVSLNYVAIGSSLVLMTVISIIYSVVSWFGKFIFEH